MYQVRMRILQAALGLLSVGLVATLVGPTWGRWFSVAGFVLMFLAFLSLTNASPPHMPADMTEANAMARYEKWIWPLIALCFVIFFACAIAASFASGGDGMPDGDGSIFANRSEYRLNQHGTYTTVTRGRYLVAGAGFIIAWHMIGFVGTLFLLHRVLHRRRPKLLK